jgi:hypothetical protein
MTMNGSDPPSSRTAFLTCAAAVEATARPAGQGDRLHARVLDDGRDLSRSDQEGREGAFREAGTREEGVEVERRLRHVRRVLQNACVAGHQGRCGEAHDLPERVVPRHHGQHHTERLIAGVGA